MRRWTFKFYEPRHFDFVDVAITAVNIEWWIWLLRGHVYSAWRWAALTLFVALMIKGYRAGRRLGHCHWPWEPR